MKDSWAIAAPPALLTFTEFTQRMDVSAGIQRVGLNIVGGGIALALTAFVVRVRKRFPHRQRSGG